MGQLRFQLTIMKWLVLISLVSLVKSEDYSCPSGKNTKTITVKDGDSFSFNSNPDDADNYENKEKCTVKYKRGGSCKELKFECQSFNLQKGDKLIIGKNKYFLDEDVSETTTKKVMKVRFISNKKKTGAGAQCTIECSDPEAPGVTETPSTTEGTPEDCKCGLAQRTTKIVGGVNTEVNEYPWQAGLVSKGGSFVWCGGSLVNSRWVLTAAHCTVGDSPSAIQVLLGEHDYSVDHEADHIRADVSSIEDHPDYNSNTLDNDFSMLKLAVAVDYGSHPHIRPICLPAIDTLTYNGDTATVTGWGTTSSGGSLSSTLREVDVTVMSNSNCRNDYGYWSSEITSSMLCANVVGGGKDSCQGDSGGPLVTASGGNGVVAGQNYVQIGVVSWGIGCADANYPGVYARVTSQLSWIQENIDKAGSTCPAS